MTEAEATSMARALGCPADVEVFENSMELNGAYGYGSNPYTGEDFEFVFVTDGPGLDHDGARMILLHEIGHCRQRVEGTLYQPAPWAEWNADTFAIEHAAEFGLDPERLYWDLWDWALGHSDGDPAHGRMADRMLHYQAEMVNRGYGIQGA